MAAARDIKLKWIKGMMLVSQALLLIFTGQWLMSQYNDQRAQLKKNLTALFTDVQKNITDSLIFTNLVDTEALNKAAFAYVNAAPPAGRQKIPLSHAGLSHLIAGTGTLPKSQESKLFHLDTIAFNEIFSTQMRRNGWHFNAQWINSADSDKEERKAIFIQSNFFTHANGVVINHYDGYLFGRLLPQMLFALILLSLTGAAFWMTYRSLAAQIKLSSLKDDFISNMSHELKTPIATVKVALEALGNYGVIDDPARNREYLSMATSEMDRLELLATRVLNTSLLESGNMQLTPESYDLRRLVDEVLQAMQLRIKQQGAQVTFEVQGSAFLVRMDRLHIQGVLVNLLDNSLKYGDGAVHIRISLTECNGAIRLAFADNGPGIPEEYKDKVFEKFFRVPTGNRHKIKGYGLGLSYAAQVMRQHNGSINVRNITEGGCVFTLTF